MSGFFDSLHDRHQQHREQREERREARHEQHGRGGHQDDHDNYGSQHHGHHHADEQSYPPQFQGQGSFAPPAGPPPSSRGPPGVAPHGFERGDFASDADIERMVASGELDGRQGPERHGHGYGGAGAERGSAYGQFDAPPGPPPGQGYGQRANEYGRFDAPSGPPTGRGGQSQQPHQQQGYGTGGAYAASYSEGPARQNQYAPQQTQGRSQFETPQRPAPGSGSGQGNAPSGGFSASRDREDQYGSGTGGAPNDRSERPRRGEAAGNYDQQGQGDRYAHLAGMAQEHGEDDPEVYRRATQGLQEKIQSQAQPRQPRNDEEYKAHVDAHQKAYGGDDHGPLDADTIGSAAAVEALKQTAAGAGSPNAPAGALRAGKPSGDSSSKQGRAAQEEEEEEDTTAARAGASGGMQDKLMALAMSHAGKLFDKKNAGSNASGGDKAQAMQSAAATAMKLFTQYQSNGKIESGDIIGLVTNFL